MTLIIRAYHPDDAPAIAHLFHASVHQSTQNHYSASEREAWAPTPPDIKQWQSRLAEKQPFVADIDNNVAGFIELDPDGHIDCMYTHPNYQRMGVAQALYDALFTRAKEQQLPRLYVEASHLAKPFFAKQGFEEVAENRVERNGQTLTNYTMQYVMD